MQVSKETGYQGLELDKGTTLNLQEEIKLADHEDLKLADQSLFEKTVFMSPLNNITFHVLHFNNETGLTNKNMEIFHNILIKMIFHNKNIPI